ncbi:MAG: hypothetical protein V4638_05145 [Bacteroidota bacterium]
MDKQLQALVNEYSGKFFASNSEIPVSQQKGIQKEISNVVKNQMASQVNSGSFTDLLELFKQGTTSGDFSGNKMFGGISDDLVGSLTNKLGLPASLGTTIATSVLPSVLGSLAKKTADKNDSSINMNDIIASLSGKKTANKAGVDFNDVLGSVLGGGNSSSGGGFDLGSIAGSLVGGKQSSGGILGWIMKLFGK